MNPRPLCLANGLTLLVMVACDRAAEPSATTTVRIFTGIGS
jgi:hypothetical protein